MPAQIPDMKKFDRSELSACAFCGRGMMHDGNIYFYELLIGQCIIDLNSIRAQAGLEVAMGAAAPLAAVLAPSTNIAFRTEPRRMLVCAECAIVRSMPVAALLEEDEAPVDVSFA